MPHVRGRFIRTEADDAAGNAWEVRLARRYYAKLFREYAIADLSRYKARFNCCLGPVCDTRKQPTSMLQTSMSIWYG